MVVAIDGPGGVGKSTVTRRIAEELGLPFLDTGATYRAATLAVIRAGVDPSNADAVIETVASSDIDYRDGVVFLDGESVVGAVRSAAVTAAVSEISAYAAVRDVVTTMQRRWVADRGGRAVVEGRDIGTAVFPDAPVKVYLTASAAVRAARRAGDAEVVGSTVADIAADLARRDQHDSTRDAAPLQAAADAHVLDTSDLDVDGVVDAVLSLVQATEQAEQYGG